MSQPHTINDDTNDNGGVNVGIVDFGPFLDGTDKQGVGDAMLEAFKTIGFVYIVNHGLEQERIEEMFEWVRCGWSSAEAPTLILRRLFPRGRFGAQQLTVEEVFRIARGGQGSGTPSTFGGPSSGCVSPFHLFSGSLRLTTLV